MDVDTAGATARKNAFEPNKNIVFLLGAGASVAHGPPLMAGFMIAAFDRYYSLKQAVANPSEQPTREFLKSYAKMFGFRDKCRRTLWAIDRDWDNIEELYTQADLLRLVEHRGDEITEQEQLCNHIASVIWDIYRGANPNPFMSKMLDKVREGGGAPVIVTTNYDLIVENAIKDAKQHWYYPGFALGGTSGLWTLAKDTHKPVPLKTARAEATTSLPIIKLHGSVNWFRMEDGWFADEEIAVYQQKVAFADVNRSIYQRWRQLTNRTPADPESTAIHFHPAIIPPMLGKAKHNQLFAQQWAAAIDAIRRASQIIVIGYSFPSTDAFMSRLLTEALSEQQDFRRLTVVDTVEPEKHGIHGLLATRLRTKQFRYVRQMAEYVVPQLSSREFDNWEQILK